MLFLENAKITAVQLEAAAAAEGVAAAVIRQGIDDGTIVVRKTRNDGEISTCTRAYG